MEIIYIIVFILTIVIIYLIYKTRNLPEKLENLEKFAPTQTEINQMIANTYKVDLEAMRNLGQITKDIYINKDNFTLPTNITIPGNLRVSGNVYFDNKIDGIFNIIPPGFIMAHYAGYDPLGWAPCDGNMYKLLDNGKIQFVTTGGTQTPDLRSRFIIGAPGGMEKINGVEKAFSTGPIFNANTDGSEATLTARPYLSKGGDEEVALTEAQLPAHNHKMFSAGTSTSVNSTQSLTTDTVVAYQGLNAQFGAIESYIMVPPSDGLMTQLKPEDLFATLGKTSDVGGNTKHNNMPPYFSLKYYMKL
jgi:microcystin-dependent protein